MTNKLKRKKKSKSKSSSWGSAIKSFLKEFFLNDVNGCYMEYDENLTKEGKRKKTLIWAVIFINAGLYLISLPFGRRRLYAEYPFLTLIIEITAIAILILGILKLKHTSHHS